MRWKAAVSVVVGLLCAVSVPSRAEEPAAAQDPEHVGFLTRAVRKFLSGSAEEGPGPHLGPLLPRLEFSSVSGFAPMVHVWVPDLGGSPVDLHASAGYSTKRFQYYDLRLGLLPHEGAAPPSVERGTSRLFPLSDLDRNAAAPGFGVWASAVYRDYPGEAFYGLGPASLLGLRSDYRLRDETYEVALQVQQGRVTLTARGALLGTSIAAGTDAGYPDTGTSNDDTTAPGLLHAPDFVRLSAGLWLEARDEPRDPHRGLALGVAVSRFDDRRGRAFQWTRFNADARQYVSLGSPRHVIALRQVVSLDAPDAGSRVPFFLQATGGGGDLLRGYRAYRFRDDQLLATALEYRFELHPKVELVLIHEAGQVASSIDAFSLGRLRHGFGAGVRLKSAHHVELRIDVLHSPEGTRIHVDLGPSF